MKRLVCLLMLLIPGAAHASIFGEEDIPLWKLVVGQVAELDHLARIIGVSESERDALNRLNEGVGQATAQIDAIQSIIERVQGLDPSSIKNLSDLNAQLEQAKGILSDTQEVLSLKILLCDQAISQSAIQTDTAYRMGQEMAVTGSDLAQESRTASPGRASQISAAASSAQMLSSGVELQTLAQIAQLQALSLELQKAQLKRQLTETRDQDHFVERALSGDGGSRKGSAP